MASIPFKGGHGTVSTSVFLEDRKKKEGQSPLYYFQLCIKKIG